MRAFICLRVMHRRLHVEIFAHSFKNTTLFAYTRSSVTSRPGFLAYNRSSHTSRHTWLLTSVKCEIFHPLSLGKWISEQATSTTTPAAAVHYASLQLDLL